jgi:succinoglycan biosynthesis protein ExoU
MTAQQVCVVIAARNAARTIATAISSALREPEVGEVVVVDDASTDDTHLAVTRADDGSGRMTLIRFEQNRGPAHARNIAIAHSTSPYLSILDADDFFIPGRFGRLLATQDWDLVADNIAFVADFTIDPGALQVPSFRPNPRFLDLAEFVAGNISKPGRQRGELGFLKPVIRRAALEENGLVYEERLRLGEDYELYARALAAGARFKLVDTCGYGATVRADSLSGRHRTDDLKRLADADLSLLALPGLPADALAQLRRHERHVRDKYRLRHFLDIKADAGLFAAAVHGLRHPGDLPAIVTGIVRDKLAGLRRPQAPVRTVRYLLAGEHGSA